MLGADEAAVEAWLGVGQGQLQAGEWRAAARSYRRVTELAPGRVGGWAGLALAHFVGGEARPGLEALERARTVDPGAPGLGALERRLRALTTD
jgi:predicted TPR repeat methyltransferase